MDQEKTRNIQLIRLPEVTARMKISRTSIHRLQSKGEFPMGIRIGGIVLWDESELNDYLHNKIKESQERRKRLISKTIQ